MHAAAGGVGLLLIQLLAAAGARVIGTCSSAEKEALARAAGAHDVVRYDRVDFADEVRRLTGGRGCDVVYDSVGQSTFEGSLRSLRPRGLLVLFGQSSGPVPPFELGRLNALGSLFVTRPSLAHYTADRAELELRSGAVLGAIAAGRLARADRRALPAGRGRRGPSRARGASHHRQGAAAAMSARLAALAALALLAGCARNPVSGLPEFVVMSSERERELGAEQEKEFLAELGRSDHAATASWVEAIGARLARALAAAGRRLPLPRGGHGGAERVRAARRARSSSRAGCSRSCAARTSSPA